MPIIPCLTVFWELFCGNMIITTPFIFLIPLFIKGSQWLRCARDHARVWLLNVGGRLPLFDGGPTSGPHPGQILWTDHWYAPKIIMARKTQYRIFTKKWQLYKHFLNFNFLSILELHFLAKRNQCLNKFK